MNRKTARCGKFSVAFLDAIPTPDTRVDWWDADVPGLVCRVSPAGSKVFYWMGRTGGIADRVKIGAYPEWKIPQARNEAKRLAFESAHGRKPITARQESSSEFTLDELFSWWLQFHAIPHRKNWKKDERRYLLKLKHLGSKKISAVTTTELVELHAMIGEKNGPVAANETIGMLRQMYAKAIKPLGQVTSNPTDAVSYFPTHARERFLLPDELPRFLTAVFNLQRSTTQDFILLSLFTGARRSNVAAMRFDQIDVAGCTWRVPPSIAKSKRQLTIVLPQAAMDIINRRIAARGASPYVLPGYGSTGHIVEPKQAIQKILKEASKTGNPIIDIRFHDLRRTLGSWMAPHTPLAVIAKQLGHSSLKSTQIYARLDLDPVRLAVEKASSAMNVKENKKDSK